MAAYQFKSRSEESIYEMLSKIINLLEEEVNIRKTDNPTFKQIPHKCPVCEGCGNGKGTKESNPNFDFHMEYASCHACEGKGILWG
jgi:DnaJ-class molecular chaperone